MVFAPPRAITQDLYNRRPYLPVHKKTLRQADILQRCWSITPSCYSHLTGVPTTTFHQTAQGHSYFKIPVSLDGQVVECGKKPVQACIAVVAHSITIIVPGF
ncbi:hypothetical protein FRB93_007871 [Tulasnella sp. JGI-2019a]|nr:hypothetical protein FRB93_007871 [Tulasnella sp. JGI-2019a]